MAPVPVSELVGRVLADRYRLTALVGAGASAQVYVADDVQLRRRVAVKVLHPALAHDPTFLRRFQAEAQAAAALNHPNLVAVYDWGQDDLPFLVSEYLEGGSLRTVLHGEHREPHEDGRHLLSVSQTLVVGLEAARGLHYAHSRGFVHRDVKPANLLFGDDRRLRIADFGLARALAEAAWTEPEGVVLGTARYVSPEQAAGSALDGRSDVYSLALVLVECVTGRVPHAADTAIASLHARIGRPIEAPPELGPLGPIVEAAGRADPTRRSSAAQLGRALMAVAGDLPSPEPLTLGPVPVDAGALLDAEPSTVVVPARAVHLRLDGSGVVPTGRVDPLDPVDDRAWTPERLRPPPPPPPPPPPSAVAAPAAAAGGATPEDLVDEVPGALEPPGPRPRRAGRWAMAVLLVAALATLGVLAVSVLRGQGTPRLFPVGDFRGQQLGAVEAALPPGADWRIDRRETRRDDTRPGQILEQSPAAGGQLEEGGVLQLTVSQGDELRTVPDLSDLPVDGAAKQLAGLGLVLAQPNREQWSETAPAGSVLDVVEKGQQLPKAAHVTLVVSKGPEPRTVPQVSGSPDAAAAALTALGLAPATIQDYSETVTAGQVIGTDPPAGTQVPKGTPVNVVVSLGRRPVPVPDVIGKSASDASDVLEASGLVVRTDGAANKPVIATDPAAGTQLHIGDQVIIITQRT